MDTHEDHDSSAEDAGGSNHDPQLEPGVSLPEQELKALGEDGEELFKMRAKLFLQRTVSRLGRQEAAARQAPEAEGTGTIRLTRRDKTLEVCAQHLLLAMELSQRGRTAGWSALPACAPLQLPRC